MEIFFNELSSPVAQTNIGQACQLLNSFVGAVSELSKISGKVTLNLGAPFADFRIGEFSLAQLRNRSECADGRVLLKRIVDRSPLRRVIEELQAPDPAVNEYRIHADFGQLIGAIAEGLGLSCAVDGVAVSFASDAIWAENTVPLEHTGLNELGGVVSTRVEARNYCSREQVNAQQVELRALSISRVTNGSELWDRRAQLFPHIRFIPRTEEQLRAILNGDPVLVEVCEKLSGIDNATNIWRETQTPHPAFPFATNPESSNRIQQGLVDFNDSNGVQKTFSDHAYFGPIEGRIHFIVEGGDDRHVLIGHVGKKLGIG